MPHYPTQQNARTVEMWTRAGIGPERIAARLGIPVDILRNNYPFELGFTDEESLAVVADTAYQMAICGKFPTMTRFWLEARGGWVPGRGMLAGQQAKPLQVIIDGDVVEGEYEEMDSDDNVVELHPDDVN